MTSIGVNFGGRLARSSSTTSSMRDTAESQADASKKGYDAYKKRETREAYEQGSKGGVELSREKYKQSPEWLERAKSKLAKIKKSRAKA